MLIWSAAHHLRFSLFEHQHDIRSAAFSPDGTRVLTAGSDRTARILNIATGTTLVAFVHASELWYAAFSPDGTRVITLGSDETVRIWDAAEGSMVAVLDDPG